MFKSENSIYDVVIIGAGIGGLVCGCYLAQAGMKVLIAEQHSKPGGYCTSFRRKGITFDAAAHSFGGFRKDGIVRKVFGDLEITGRLKITRYDPSDIIITPDCTVKFYSDMERTIEELENAFKEYPGRVKEFFTFLLNPAQNSFISMRAWTYKDLLDRYFSSPQLKSVLSFPIFGNGALPPSRISAFIGAKILTEFILDGGYYPDGGMQCLPDILAARFQEYGGTLLCSTFVEKIRVKGNKVMGVVVRQGDYFAAKCVVSNCDTVQTFCRLLNLGSTNRDFVGKMRSMIPSLSMFVLYLGLDGKFNSGLCPGSNMWYLPSYDIESMYLVAMRRNMKNLNEYMLRVSPDRRNIVAFTHTPYRNESYWVKNKVKFMEAFIKKLSLIMPDIAEHIIYKDAATPATLYRYTLNYRGAAYGWESILSQLALPDFRKPSFIDGLYLCGHWVTQGLGIPGVTYIGYDTARQIISKKNRGLL